MIPLIQLMKTIATVFNNYYINQNAVNVNRITRVECERNVCRNELKRLRYGLENLLKNNSNDGNKFIYHHEYYSTPYKSLLYKILEDRLYTNHEIDETSLDSINIVSSADSNHLTTETISSFSSDISTLKSSQNPSIDILDINDYEKSTLQVPNSQLSRTKKSKKRKISNKKSHSYKRKKKK